MTTLQKACRGRVQAQGDDIAENGGYSCSWARMTPVTEQEGLLFLATIQAQCNKSQQAERQQAFSKAKRFVQNASKQGGIGPEAQPPSFQNTKRAVGNARVDIEIASGLTFVPEKSS
ncbi:hypothetical protein H6G28_31845 [Nostoc sp. FACHB-190]|nr:hypothetical protein [Nostoc sp. FACHB-190]